MSRARRSHPPTLIKLVERALNTECRLERGARVVLGVSGGGDSQALLDVLARLAPRQGFELFAHAVDHGLRPEASAELDLAEALARSHRVSFGRSKLRLAPGGNLMARARAARYQALSEAAARAGASLVATAHHADDRAETVLLRLLRGAGPRGLCVLPARAGALVRPMIRARRTDVQAHLGRHGIPFATDPSNENPRFARTRVRRELLPLLEELSPRIVEHLVALADQLEAGSPPDLRDPTGAPLPLGRAHVRALVQALGKRDPGAQIWLPGGRVAQFDPVSGTARIARGAAKRRKSD